MLITSLLLMVTTTSAQISTATPAPLVASDTNREIVQTYVQYYIRQRDYSIAEEYLIDHLRQDRMDSDAWNVLGIAFFKKKRYPAAAKSFRKAVKHENGLKRGVFLYNYADALTRLKRTDQAINQLKKALEYPMVASSAEHALGVISAGEALPPIEIVPPSAWTLYLAMEGGYDSNVLLSSDSTLATATATKAASPALSVLGAGGFKSPLWNGWGNAQLSLRSAQYFTEDARQYNTVQPNLSLSWGQRSNSDRPSQWKLTNRLAAIYLNTDGYGLYNWTESLSWSIEFQHSRRHATSFTVPITYQKFSTDTGDANNRSGPVMGIQAKHVIDFRYDRVSFGTRYDQIIASGANYKARALGLSLGWGRPFIFNTSVGAEIKPIWTAYPSSSESRSDTSIQFTPSIGRKVIGELYASLSYTFLKNLSTVSAADYTKHTTGILMSYAFL